MKTASFFSYVGPGRISIARWAPRGLAAGYKVYKPLAPHGLQNVDNETYKRLYALQLDTLEPQRTWDELHKLAGEWEPVLQCWETMDQIRRKVPGKEFCHRHIVADWFKSKLGLIVPEYVRPQEAPAQSNLNLTEGESREHKC